MYLSIHSIDDQDIVATKPTFKTIPTPLVIMNMVAAVPGLGLRQVRPSVWLTTARRLQHWVISVVSGSGAVYDGAKTFNRGVKRTVSIW